MATMLKAHSVTEPMYQTRQAQSLRLRETSPTDRRLQRSVERRRARSADHSIIAIVSMGRGRGSSVGHSLKSTYCENSVDETIQQRHAIKQVKQVQSELELDMMKSIKINLELPLFKTHPELTELVKPVYQMFLKTTYSELLSAGDSTTRNPLESHILLTIVHQLGEVFTSTFPSKGTPKDRDMVKEAAWAIARENVDLAIKYVQRLKQVKITNGGLPSQDPQQLLTVSSARFSIESRPVPALVPAKIDKTSQEILELPQQKAACVQQIDAVQIQMEGFPVPAKLTRDLAGVNVKVESIQSTEMDTSIGNFDDCLKCVCGLIIILAIVALLLWQFAF